MSAAKVVTYLDCGCAIREDGSRAWCPTCMENTLKKAADWKTCAASEWKPISELPLDTPVLLRWKHSPGTRPAYEIGMKTMRKVSNDEVLDVRGVIECIGIPGPMNVSAFSHFAFIKEPEK